MAIAGPHRHHVALLAQVLDRLDQQQFDAPVGGLGEPLGGETQGRFFDLLWGMGIRSLHKSLEDSPLADHARDGT